MPHQCNFHYFDENNTCKRCGYVTSYGPTEMLQSIHQMSTTGKTYDFKSMSEEQRIKMKLDRQIDFNARMSIEIVMFLSDWRESKRDKKRFFTGYVMGEYFHIDNEENLIFKFKR